MLRNFGECIVSRSTACGTLSLGSWPNDRIGEDTAVQVKFDEPFASVPEVEVMLAAIDAMPMHKRLDTWASDVTCEGFRLHVRTWADSVTWMVKVSWIASTEHHHVQFGRSSSSNVTQRISEDSAENMNLVYFPHPMPCTPDVALGFTGVDASGDANLCVISEIGESCSRGIVQTSSAWRPQSIAWKLRTAWIASSSPAVLQTGTQAFGHGPDARAGDLEDPIVRDDARSIDVWFQKPFHSVPSVALALVGIDATSKKPLRIDTWTDSVTNEGFRLHVRTWENSELPFVKVTWLASATTKDITVEWLAPHSPPKEFVVLGAALGQGVNGVTHRAKHVLDGQIYAVKTCKHPFRDHEESLRRELENLARLPIHRNLLRYHTSMLEADRLHIVTECLDAFKFAELLPAPDGLYPSKHSHTAVLRWISQVLDGLAKMHSIGMVHRDLHSENVLVLRDPRNVKRPSQECDAVRIIDFGVGKVSTVCKDSSKERMMSQSAGFYHYASPERRRGQPFNDRDDVWAVGCHLLELYTGRAIRKRSGCGRDGNDFALCPEVVRKAVQECTSARCRNAAGYLLLLDAHCRPSAASARDYIRAVLRPQMEVDRLGCKRSRQTSRGGRRVRPCNSPCFTH
mmetsp:Transcript_6557/g.10479  ORF Transcript_6557/g.10479 Transcript_6557/m.10479 type:complete len:628 (-) Transcript_6557:51-1934(-)